MLVDKIGVPANERARKLADEINAKAKAAGCTSSTCRVHGEARPRRERSTMPRMQRGTPTLFADGNPAIFASAFDAMLWVILRIAWRVGQ